MKDAIAATLLNLMENYPFSRISVTMICEHVPVSRTAFYHYFKNKEEVIVYFIQQDFMNNCFPIFRFHLKERGAQAFFSYLKKHKTFYIKLYQNGQEELLFKSLKAAYKAGFDERQTFTQDVPHKKLSINPEVFFQYSSSGIAAVVIYWIKQNMQIPEDTIARELYLMMEEPLGIVRDYRL